MSRFDSPLNNLRVASPCSVDWSAMQGDERKRYCGDCKLSVYNLSAMTRYDAEHLLRMSEGRLCVRYYQRADGTIITNDCPVGWARVKQRVTLLAATVFSLIFSLFGAMTLTSGIFSRRTHVVGQIAMPRAVPTPRPIKLMGDIAMPSPSPNPVPRAVMGEMLIPVQEPRSEKKSRPKGSRPARSLPVYNAS